VIEKLTSALQTHTVGPCSLSQNVVAATLDSWGDAGLDAHLRRLQAEYARRCAVLCRAAAQELGGGLAEWQVPRAGMFLWVKINGIEDSTEVWEALRDAKIIVCPGKVMAAAAAGGGGGFRKSEDMSSSRDRPTSVFAARNTKKSSAHQVKSPFVRVAFSSVDCAGLKEGMKRLGNVLLNFQQEQREQGHAAAAHDMVVV
jgi:kynurenine/2-aminoadipate aminotransferase